jgi:Ca2+/Na+ antiporter
MIGFLRLAFFGYIALTVLYFLLAIYSRSTRREELEKDWDAAEAQGDTSLGPRDDYIAAGMAQYERGLRKKLIWLVYVIPTLAVIAAIYLLNFA